MPKHVIDRSGLPLDPVLRSLEVKLHLFAKMYSNSINSDKPEIRHAAGQNYKVTLGLMYEKGWDGLLDKESFLPPEYMEEYLARHPLP